MRGIVTLLITVIAFSIVQGVFGRAVSVWCALIVLAYCIGVFWGAGDQMRKQRERDGEMVQ